MSRRALLLSPLVFLIAFTAIKVTDCAEGRGLYPNDMQVAAPCPNVLGGAISAMGKLRSRNFATQSSLASPAGASLDASAIFLEAPEYGTGGNNAISLAVADLNGDGKLDLGVANGCVLNSQCGSQTAGIVGGLLGNGEATFQSAVTYFAGSSQVDSVSLAGVHGGRKA